MKHRLPSVLFRAATTLALSAVSAVMLVPTAAAQNAPPRNAIQSISSDTDKRPYDKHDFNGVWSRNARQFKLAPCPECADPPPGPFPGYGFLGTPPPRTPEGEKKFQVNKPSRGYELGSKEANA